MQAFTLLLCIGLIGNSLGLPRAQWSLSSGSGNSLGLLRPQWPLSSGSESENDIVSVPKEVTVTDGVNLKPNLESNHITLGDTNKDSGTKLQPQLKSENMKQETDISKNGLTDKIEYITGQLGTLMKNESQIIVVNLGDIAENLELLANSFVMELISEKIEKTKDKLTKTISNGIKSAVGSQTGKQIGEQIKAMSDKVNTMFGKLSSAVQQQLMNTIGPESMLQILTKIGEIETTVGRMENDVEKIVEKTHIIENIEHLVSNVTKQVEAFVGEDAVHKIETIAHAVENGVSGAVGEIKEIINDVNEVEN